MAEKKNLLTFEDIVKIIADRYNVPTEIVEDIIIGFTKILYEGMRSEFKYPESESASST